MLPAPDYHVKHATLAEDTLVSVISIVNASKTRQEQISSLNAPERSFDVEERAPAAYKAKKSDEYKYTVRDACGTTAFLLSHDVWPANCTLRVHKGTAIWRGVLLPQPNEATLASHD